MEGVKHMWKKMTIIMLLVFLAGCSGDDSIQESIESNENYEDIKAYEEMNLQAYEPSSDWGGGSPYYLERHRPLFYDMTYPFAGLVGGGDVFDAWLLSRSQEERGSEHVAVSFIRYFNISREDFERANEQMRRSWESWNFPSLEFAHFEIYDVDLIFSFDNERINEYFLWENSPFMSDFGKGMERGDFRPLFYNMPAPFANLVGREVFIEWRRSRSPEEIANENIAVSFIRYFDISRVDFTRANEEVRLFWERELFTPEQSSTFETYPVDLIFTFDNARINEYFLWENSPAPHERGWGQNQNRNIARLHFYGRSDATIEIPIQLGQSLCPETVADITRQVAGEGPHDNNGGWAFWGWFTDEQLNSSGRVRDGNRRPTVGHVGFDLSTVITEEIVNSLAVGGNIDLYAVWARWGDVNDDGRVDIDDIDALRRNVFGLTPRNPINEASSDVLRDGYLDIDDIDVLRRNVFGLTPRLVMGQRSAGTATPASLFNARMDSFGNLPAIWSISHETIAPDATYVNVRVRLDQIPTGGIHGDGISTVFFGIQYNPTFLSNPRRAEIIVLDRSLFNATQQMIYDMFVAQGWTEEDFIANPVFATAVVNIAENLGGYGFSYILWNGGNNNAQGHDHGENIIALEWSPATGGSHNPTAYVFVTFRFDVATDNISLGDVAYIASTAAFNPMHSGGIIGNINSGSVTIQN